MADIIPIFDQSNFDFEGAVNEIELLVPKYLHCLEDLEKETCALQVHQGIRNIQVYWKRLEYLIEEVQKFEEDSYLDDALLQSQQSELSSLETIYMQMSQQIQMTPKHLQKDIWKALDSILSRMDELLKGMGFEDDHRDRRFVIEIQKANLSKMHQVDDLQYGAS